MHLYWCDSVKCRVSYRWGVLPGVGWGQVVFFIIYNLIMLPVTGVTPGKKTFKYSRGDSFYFPRFFFIFSVLFTPELSHCFSS